MCLRTGFCDLLVAHTSSLERTQSWRESPACIDGGPSNVFRDTHKLVVHVSAAGYRSTTPQRGGRMSGEYTSRDDFTSAYPDVSRLLFLRLLHPEARRGDLVCRPQHRRSRYAHLSRRLEQRSVGLCMLRRTDDRCLKRLWSWSSMLYSMTRHPPRAVNAAFSPKEPGVVKCWGASVASRMQERACGMSSRI